MGIPTSQNPDTPEGLESRLSIGIHRILTELPHSTEIELERRRRIRIDSSGASTLELLQGFAIGQEVLRPSEPCLSLYSIKNELGSTVGS
jgi:hypothetical protein